MKKSIVVALMLLLAVFGKLSAQEFSVISLTEKEFKEKVVDYTDANATYKGTLPCIVDFYATWCRPCKMMAPILEELAAEYGGKIVIYKVDVDAEKAMAQAIGIRSMPTLYFFPVEGNPSYAIGLRSKAEMEELIQAQLKP